MTADMHMHSRYSDGSDWPEELIAKAVHHKLQLVCLTDHDTMGGTASYVAAARGAGLHSYPAVEVDCNQKEIGYKSELLVYFPDGRYEQVDGLLCELLTERTRIIGDFCNWFSVQYELPELTVSTLLAQRSGSGEGASCSGQPFRLSKTDIYRYLAEKAVLPKNMSYKQFKKTCFEKGPLKNRRIPKPEVRHLAALAKSDGGFLVLPHFGHEFDDNAQQLHKDRKRMLQLLKWFYAAGVRGLEMYPYKNDAGNRINSILSEAAQKIGFFLTWGSDCHGSGSDKERLGSFSGVFDGFPQRIW
ncbi:MAG: PHP domain-containing protein [Spirochaetes bacterium]|nr:PHP domain-containing protein [Spirochaetota bacterium]